MSIELNMFSTDVSDQGSNHRHVIQGSVSSILRWQIDSLHSVNVQRNYSLLVWFVRFETMNLLIEFSVHFLLTDWEDLNLFFQSQWLKVSWLKTSFSCSLLKVFLDLLRLFSSSSSASSISWLMHSICTLRWDITIQNWKFKVIHWVRSLVTRQSESWVESES